MGAVGSTCSCGADVVLGADFFDTDSCFLVEGLVDDVVEGLVAAVFVAVLLTVAFLLVVVGRAVMTPAL